MTIEDTPEGNKIKPPLWLDESFLLEPLRGGLNAPQLEIISLHIKPATAMGDNYVSQMFRATLSIRKTPSQEPERLSIVIKTLPKKGKATEMIQEWSIFKKESIMLTEILPKINKLLMETYPDSEPLSAKCLWYGDDPEEVIILEDLKEDGFTNADRRSGMDRNLADAVLESMAKFHAASYALLQTEPNLFETFWENMWSEKFQGQFEQFMDTIIQTIIDEVKSWEETPKEYISRLENMKPGLLQRVFKVAKHEENAINVMQHGDSWTNNFMFRRENDNITGFRFVDFQLSNVNSAALDLNYFIFTSPKTAFRVEKIDEMLSTYYEMFMKTISDLNITLEYSFTLEELKAEFLNRLLFGFIAMMFVFPITVLEPKNAPDINDFMEENTSMNHLYQSEAFKKGFLDALPYFVENGVL